MPVELAAQRLANTSCRLTDFSAAAKAYRGAMPVIPKSAAASLLDFKRLQRPSPIAGGLTTLDRALTKAATPHLKTLRDADTAVRRITTLHTSRLADLDRALTKAATPHLKTLRDADTAVRRITTLHTVPASVSRTFEGLSASIWPKTGLQGLMPRLPSLHGLLEQTVPAWLRHASTRAAMRARLALMQGYERWEAIVDEFTARLGLGQPREWREAVSTALAGAWVDRVHDTRFSPQEVVECIRREAREAHAQAQPLWERKTSPGRVWLLDTPLGQHGTVLGDLQTDAGGMDAAELALQWQLSNPHVQAVLALLSVPEKRVALVWAFGWCETWAEAAAMAGAADPEAFGIRVRRKLDRLGRRHADLMRSAAATRHSQTAHAAGR
ncbi:hypothetical protein ACFRFU_46805 [Streptomyces sp. NPDC056704]|uniref:hypothetical protein n=1 Tax=Streptomyces sp. NPDC056704 TaxID=3345917 RepID=UPI0036A91238